MKRLVPTSLLVQGVLAALLCVGTASAEVTLITMVHFGGTNGYLVS